MTPDNAGAVPAHLWVRRITGEEGPSDATSLALEPRGGAPGRVLRDPLP